MAANALMAGQLLTSAIIKTPFERPHSQRQEGKVSLICPVAVGTLCKPSAGLLKTRFCGRSVRVNQHAGSLTCPRPAANSRRPGVASAALDLFVLTFEGVLADPSGNLFPGVKDALKGTESPFYILTGLKPTSVSSALQQGAGMDIPADSPRIISKGGDKIAALKMVAARPLAQDPSTSLHFVDSDPSDLKKAAQDPTLQRWQLYRAAWGEPDEGKAPPPTPAVARIVPASMEGFAELMRWGLLMGVNDGCQEYEDGRPAT